MAEFTLKHISWHPGRSVSHKGRRCRQIGHWLLDFCDAGCLRNCSPTSAPSTSFVTSLMDGCVGETAPPPWWLKGQPHTRSGKCLPFFWGGGNFLYIVPMVRVNCGLWVFVSKCKHLLNTLSSLKYIILRIFWITGKDCTLSACEGALGLALLASVERTHVNVCVRFRIL